MIQHFLSVGAAILFTFLATVSTQYEHFRGPSANQPSDTHTVVIESPGISTSSPSPFETLVTGIAERIASSSATTTVSTTTKPAPTIPVGPVSPSVPSVPFKPLPVPTPPPITPTSPANPTPTPPPAPTTPPAPTVEQKLSDEALLKGAIVNIICLPGGGIRGSSGTGVIVDSRGIVLTVAHVAQGFLLRDYPTKGAGTCYIRTGSPAKNAYSADLIFISPTWIQKNHATFLQSNPSGTGENDFAFVAITGTITSTSLPSRFTAIPLSPANTKVRVDDQVGTGSYAAEFLSSSELRSSLYPTIKFASVEDVYTFGKSTTDIFSVAAGSAAQEGSSGGAVINDEDYLIGLISTRTVRPNLANRSLQAITMDHLRRSFREDMNADLDSYLKGSLPALVNAFKSTASSLLEDLSDDIAGAR